MGGGARRAGHLRRNVPGMYGKASLTIGFWLPASVVVRHYSDGSELSECQCLFDCVVLI